MKGCFIYSLCLLSVTTGNTQAQIKKRPNLLIVMADQFRGEALGFAGKELVKTPNLDAFASNAVVFNQAISGYPLSSPARGMFLSGAYPHNNGVLTNCQSQSATQNVELKKEIICWSDILKAEGYHTAYIGKWHLDKPMKPYIDCANNKGEMAWNEWCPPDRRHGFDYWTSYGTYDYHLRPLYWNTDGKREDFYYVDQWGPEYETDLAIQFLDSIQYSQQPFAIMVSMNPPHTGYELVPDKYKQLYKKLNTDSIVFTLPHLYNTTEKYINIFKNSLPNYYACITGVDEQFGRLIQTLKENGQYNNTIIVFVSDHGDSMGMHGNIGKNIYYEEAIRIPFFIAWNNQLSPRQDNELLISLEDFYPTIMSLMGMKDKIPPTVQTRDLSEQVKGNKECMPQYQLYMQYSKVNASGPHLTTGARGLRSLNYTYVVKFEDGKITERLLFNRKNDPYQMRNIINEDKKTANYMHQLLKQAMDEINDPVTDIL